MIDPEADNRRHRLRREIDRPWGPAFGKMWAPRAHAPSKKTERLLSRSDTHPTQDGRSAFEDVRTWAAGSSLRVSRLKHSLHAAMVIAVRENKGWKSGL